MNLGGLIIAFNKHNLDIFIKIYGCGEHEVFEEAEAEGIAFCYKEAYRAEKNYYQWLKLY